MYDYPIPLRGAVLSSFIAGCVRSVQGIVRTLAALPQILFVLAREFQTGMIGVEDRREEHLNGVIKMFWQSRQ